jgi:ATP-dependent Clp protease ATP-binding subunit ClpA
MTSNLGSHHIQSLAGKPYEVIKEVVWDELKQTLRPEFLNRIDEVVVFHELSKEEITEIVDIQIKRVREQLQAQGYGLELTQDTKYFLSDQGYDPEYGARPLRRAIQRLIEDPLSERILYKEFNVGDTIIVDVEDDADGKRGIAFRTLAGPVEPPPMELAGTGPAE